MRKHNGMRPQDVLILLKISAYCNKNWNGTGRFSRTQPLPKHGQGLSNKVIAVQIQVSPSEVTESLARSTFAGLYNPEMKMVMSGALSEFLQYGIRYVFPQQPGALVRGIPTAHSAKPLSDIIQSNEPYVWPSTDGHIRGQAIEPLYPTVVRAIDSDPLLYEMLALVDALRVGQAREVKLAVEELRKRLQSEQ